MIHVNEYFDGSVKSLGYTRVNGKSTIGVMEPGEYTFNTGSRETMVVIEGAMEVLLHGEEIWKTYQDGRSFDVPGDSSFQVKVATQTSYLCRYD